MNVANSSYLVCMRSVSSCSETPTTHPICSPTYRTNSIQSEITQHFSDNQWAEHYQELFRLAYRKLSRCLSPKEQVAFFCKLYGVCHETMHDAIETEMQLVYAKFGVDTLYQLVRYAVFTSDEEIESYVES